jgi:hypothetical protein
MGGKNETDCEFLMDIVSRRAVSGGEFIAGKQYKGGQFIPKDALAIQAGLDARSVSRGIKRLEKAIRKAAFENFFHAAASIRKDARQSIKRSDTPGPPGGPIRSKRGRGGGLAKRAILFKVDKTGAVIGFSAAVIDQAMEVHEHGKERGGVRFPKRPTMQPALERNLARFHREWRGAIS